MIWPVIGFLWRGLHDLRWPVLWLLSPKYTIGVNAIILDEAGRVWLQQHRFWPGKQWGLPGGIVSANEPPEFAIQREIKEEIGLEVQSLQIVTTELFYRRGISICYKAQVKPGVITLDHKELLDGNYFKSHELPENTLPSHRALIQAHSGKDRNA